MCCFKITFLSIHYDIDTVSNSKTFHPCYLVIQALLFTMFKDKRKLEIIKNLRKELVILKPDKGNGIVLIGTNDYYTAIENLFSDKSKFNSKFNSFNKNLKFTVGTFENCVPHFLDIEICPNGLGIYHKNTQTGQYSNIESFTSWKWKTWWITSLTIRAKRICSRYHLNQEINLIKDDAAWTGFPEQIANSVITRALQANNSNTTRSKKVNLNYSDETAERMVKSCIKKLYRSFKREFNVKFVTHYKTTKMSFFTNSKDKTPSLSQSFVVYKFTCPSCSCNYIGKTERTLHERT